MTTIHDGAGIHPSYQIWSIDEILRNNPAYIPSGCESTLASCARVSRALSEPALDALWRKISDLVPLLKLLSRSLREEGKQGSDGTTFVRQSRFLWNMS